MDFIAVSFKANILEVGSTVKERMRGERSDPRFVICSYLRQPNQPMRTNDEERKILEGRFLVRGTDMSKSFVNGPVQINHEVTLGNAMK